MRREKQPVSYLGHPGLSKGEFHGWEQPGSVASCVAMCLLEMNVFQMDARSITSLRTETYTVGRVVLISFCPESTGKHRRARG